MSKIVIRDFMGEIMKMCPYPANYVPPREDEDNRKEINITINVALNIGDNKDKNL